MLTPEQDQLARAVDAMRANDELVTKLALALKKAEADRDAYLQHLEVAQAEVAYYGKRIYQLGTTIAEIVDALGWTTIAHEDEERGIHATLMRLRAYAIADHFRSRPQPTASANTTAAGAAPAPAAQADASTPADPTDDGSSEDRFSQNRE